MTDPGRAGATSSRVSGMDGVRALAALSIVVYHTWLYGGPGETAVPLPSLLQDSMPHLALGVTVFFTLSGFLLYRPFAAALLGDRERPSIREYLRNRALRILPAYWLVLIVVALVLGVAIRPNVAPGLSIGSLADQPGNLALAFAFLQSYRPATLYLGIGPAWSLCVEVVFYLSLPALVLVAAAMARRWVGPRIAVLAPPLTLLAVGLAGKVAAASLVSPVPVGGGDVSWRDVASLTFVAQADLFVPGMLLAVVHAAGRSSSGRTLGRAGQWGLLVAALAISGLALPLATGGGLAPYLYGTFMAISAGLVLGVVVLASDSGPGHWLAARLESPVLVAVGLISYSLFLWHEPFVHLLGRASLIASDGVGLLRNLLIVGVLALSVSAITYTLVERPALQRKRHRPEPAAVITPEPH